MSVMSELVATLDGCNWTNTERTKLREERFGIVVGSFDEVLE
jgi:hypothetical protein